MEGPVGAKAAALSKKGNQLLEPHIPEPLPRRDLSSVLRVAGRGWALVAVLVIVIAGLTVWNEARAPSRYESQTVVTAVRTPIPKENFELAVTLFATDEVLGPVVSELGLDATPGQLLQSRTLEADWVSGGGVKIVGRSGEPDEAVDLANLAAQSFKTKMEEKGLGIFTVLSGQDATEVGRRPPAIAALAGGALGGILGLSVLAAVFAFRQPLVTEQDALSEFPADRVYSVQVHMGSSWAMRRGQGVAIAPVGIDSAIIREGHLNGEQGADEALCCLLFENKRRGDRAVRHLLAEMDVLHRWSPARKIDRYWIDAADGVPLKPLERAAAVLLIVSEGSRRVALRQVSEESLALSSRPSWILVFVKRRRRKRSTEPGPEGDGLVRPPPAARRKLPPRESR